MSEAVSKCQLVGDKLMSPMHWKQPRFAYSVCWPFTKNEKRIQKFKEIGDSRYIYQNEVYKASFQHEKNYGDFKDLPRTTASEKVLCNKAFNIAKNQSQKYGYEGGFSALVYNFFDRNYSCADTSGAAIMPLVEELHKPMIRKIQCFGCWPLRVCNL